MDKTRSILETIGNAVYIAIHYIVFYGRKYPIAPAVYLLLFVWFFFLRKPAFPPAPPIYTSSPTLNPSKNPNPYSSAPVAPAPSPVVQTAQVNAFQNGNIIILRWDRPVQGHQIYVDNNRTNARCQPQECQVSLSIQPNLIYTKWTESGQSFDKSFNF